MRELVEPSDEKSGDEKSGDEKRQYTILIVEDNLDFARMLMKSLQIRFGCHTLYATNGMEVAGMVWREKPDLILMDLAMPGMDGLVTTRLLKRNAYTAHVPVVAFSNYGSVPTWQQRALEAGCALCLDKGIHLEELNQAIEPLLDGS